MRSTAGAPAAEPRRLGRAQLAFVRCWAEGLDLAGAWERYLYVGGAGDARRARGELQRLLEQLRQLARSHGRADIAALLRRDPQAIPDTGPQPPSLDDFRERLGTDFYAEAELVALYEAEYGQLDARSAARRRQRLRERLVLALQWLARVGVRDPHPEDALSSWLDERLAARLGSAGLTTLGA